MSTLGQFKRVRNVRTIWPNEARDFTPWLAANIALLSETLGFGEEGLQIQDTEVPVGAYFADIVATDKTQTNEATVLIENQYGRSDHDHFGKLLTYASGLKAATVVLICETLREEHRTALTWLNSITDDSHSFFAVELELWRIDDSPIAPKFNVVVEPDDWARMADTVKRAEARGDLTDLKKLYVQYWGAFRDYVNARNEDELQTSLRPRKPLPQQWTGFAIGRSGPELNAGINSLNHWIKVELTLNGPNASDWRTTLLEQRAEIEGSLGYKLEWEELKGTQQAIRLHLPNQDPTRQDEWPAQHAWLYEKLSDLYRVFHQRVKELS
ncbi:MAG: DUF4268 domain-containing protein [Rhodobacteraceae bacterium]|nr:MAG: DUF4268 domain-containing protein [Paracoccaceae bacterium]